MKLPSLQQLTALLIALFSLTGNPLPAEGRQRIRLNQQPNSNDIATLSNNSDPSAEFWRALPDEKMFNQHSNANIAEDDFKKEALYAPQPSHVNTLSVDTIIPTSPSANDFSKSQLYFIIYFFVGLFLVLNGTITYSLHLKKKYQHSINQTKKKVAALEKIGPEILKDISSYIPIIISKLHLSSEDAAKHIIFNILSDPLYSLVLETIDINFANRIAFNSHTKDEIKDWLSNVCDKLYDQLLSIELLKELIYPSPVELRN